MTAHIILVMANHGIKETFPAHLVIWPNMQMEYGFLAVYQVAQEYITQLME